MVEQFGLVAAAIWEPLVVTALGSLVAAGVASLFQIHATLKRCLDALTVTAARLETTQTLHHAENIERFERINERCDHMQIDIREIRRLGDRARGKLDPEE